METNWFRWIFAGESNKSQDKLASRHEGTCVIVAQTEAAVFTMQGRPGGPKVIVHVEHLGACMPDEPLLIGCPVVLMKKWKRLWNLESERAQTKTRMLLLLERMLVGMNKILLKQGQRAVMGKMLFQWRMLT